MPVGTSMKRSIEIMIAYRRATAMPGKCKAGRQPKSTGRRSLLARESKVCSYARSGIGKRISNHRLLAVPLLVLAALLPFGYQAGAADSEGTLVVNILDEGGDLVPFRAYLTDSAGDAVLPPGITNYTKINNGVEEQHILADGSLTCALPDGRYKLQIDRGLEWFRHEQFIDIHGDRRTEESITLRRWVDMNALGWFSGDTHIHRDPNEVALAVSAEDLNFGANIVYWNERNALPESGSRPNADAVATLGPYRVLCNRSQEIEHFANGWGAVLFMGDFQPVSLSRRPSHPWPSSFARDARVAGAHLDHEKVIWSSVPICAALDLVDSVGVVHNHFWPRGYISERIIANSIVAPFKQDMSPRELAEYTLELYYHLLNCGLRIGVSGGSASGVMPSPVGFERTYVRLEDDFGADQWLRALENGRSFATNGPVVSLHVNDRDIGEVIQMNGANQAMAITCTARSQGPLDRLEIIHNGEVLAVRNARPGESALSVKLTETLGPGWLAARCFERSKDTQIYAATSPVYLEHGDKPFAIAESVRFYIEYLNVVIDRTITSDQFSNTNERQRALAALENAKAFYEARLPQPAAAGQ